jgi:hypothetical protein
MAQRSFSKGSRVGQETRKPRLVSFQAAAIPTRRRTSQTPYLQIALTFFLSLFLHAMRHDALQHKTHMAGQCLSMVFKSEQKVATACGNNQQS